MEQTSRIVTVDIHGQRYPIKSSLDAAYVAELAAYVDEKMRLALKECPSGDTLKVAVLAALNIADEYFRAGDEVQDRQAASPIAPGSSSACSTWRWRPGRNGSPRADHCRAVCDPSVSLDRGTRVRYNAHPGVQVPCFACDGSEARLSRCSNPK